MAAVAEAIRAVSVMRRRMLAVDAFESEMDCREYLEIGRKLDDAPHAKPSCTARCELF